MTDRVIAYPFEQSSDTDILVAEKAKMVSIAALIRAFLGTATAVDGFHCSPGTGLTVNVGTGAIFTQVATDATGYGSLGIDNVQIMKEGHTHGTTVLSTPAPPSAGQSINYLIEVAYADADSGLTLLPYYDASNPSIPYSGPGNDGVPQNTVRLGQALLVAKAGTPAPTGTQTTPAPDSGYFPLWDVTVDFGDTVVPSGNIAQDTAAPFVATKLGSGPLVASGLIVNGLLGVNTSNPVKEVHIAGSGSAEMQLECTGGQTNFRSWNFVVNGTPGAKQEFIVRFMTDDGITTHFNAILIEPTQGLVTMLVQTPPQGDVSNSPANTAFVQEALFGSTNLTTNYTFGLADAGQTQVSAFGGGATTWTIPPNASVAFPVGTRIYGVVAIGSAVTIASTDTILFPQLNSSGNRTITAPSASAVFFTLVKHRSTSWVLDCAATATVT